MLDLTDIHMLSVEYVKLFLSLYFKALKYTVKASKKVEIVDG
jgi:hypothetical protein